MAAALILAAAVAGAYDIQSGFGFGVDLLFALILTVVAVPVASLLLGLLLSLLRIVPPLPAGFFIAATGFGAILWLSLPGLLFASILMLTACTLMATSVIALRPGFARASLRKQILTWSFLAASLAASGLVVKFLLSPGPDYTLFDTAKLKASLPSELSAPDPSQPGPYSVKVLRYGSGKSLRRPEFGPSVAIRTPTVDASPFFKDFDGWKAWIRRRYWGFGINKFPLNASVFYPAGAGPFPLFLMVHGNHQMSASSDLGYEYLCRLLASRGFIAVSLDENFLNSGLFHDPAKQQPVRGWLLLEHLRLWRQWNAEPGNPFSGKVDLDNIALAGHSRGGEAAATAALFNTLTHDPDDATISFHYGFHIKSVVAIAPPDGQYKPAEQWRMLKDVNYLTLQGASDSDVSSFFGSRQYDHVSFSGKVPAFKSELYIYRANHSQFNTSWGAADFNWVPINWFLNSRNLLPADQQRKVAQLYVSAFLEATLHGKAEYISVFRDYRVARQWLPQTLYTNRFQDHNEQILCRFDEDPDVTTTTAPGGHISATGLTVWREAKIPFRDSSRDYNGVFLGWNRAGSEHAPAQPPAYEIEVPPGSNWKSVAFSVAVTEEDAPPEPGKTADDDHETDDETNFSVEAITTTDACARVESNEFAWLLPPPHVPLTKLEQLDRWEYKDATEPVFQTIRIPMSAFERANSKFDPAELRQLRIVFDRTPTRVIILSEVTFEPNRSPSLSK